METVKIRIRLEGGEEFIPAYKTADSVGCDLFNASPNYYKVLPLDRVFIHTGVHIELPQGYEAQVRGRSGLCLRRGIVVPTGTIDSDYRGEIGVVLYNLSREAYTIQPGARVAQLVISPVVQAEFEVVEYLDDTERGDSGFGSTGY